MASRNKKRTAPEESRPTNEYYKLHTQAVDDLITADESNSPEVSEEELQKYRSGPKFKLSDWAKALLIKMWFAGSVCFFIFWGLSSYVTARLDLLVIFGIALGVVTDVITNNILRYYAKTKGGNDFWMMFPKRRYVTFFLNIVYAFVLLLCTDFLYHLINLILLAVSGGTATLGVGPILFGVFYTGFDLLFLCMKQLFLRIVSDARKSAGRL